MGRGESDAVPPPSPSLGSFALGEASRHAGRTLGQPVGSPCGEKRGASLQRPAPALGPGAPATQHMVILQTGPVPGWAVSLLVIASVFMLRIWGEHAHSQIQLPPSVCHRRRKRNPTHLGPKAQ
uniref:Uncharacterized protein n=1 Tax=Felis catus TaxID=9685 RepID=A0ABI7WI09_FELCA